MKKCNRKISIVWFKNEMRPQGNVFNYVQYFKYWIWANYSKDMIVGEGFILYSQCKGITFSSSPSNIIKLASHHKEISPRELFHLHFLNWNILSLNFLVVYLFSSVITFNHWCIFWLNLLLCFKIF